MFKSCMRGMLPDEESDWPSEELAFLPRLWTF